MYYSDQKHVADDLSLRHGLGLRIGDANAEADQVNAIAVELELQESVPLISENPQSPMANPAQIAAQIDRTKMDAAALAAKEMQIKLAQVEEDGLGGLLDDALARVFSGAKHMLHACGVTHDSQTHERDFFTPTLTHGLAKQAVLAPPMHFPVMAL